jgi:hypothetical protein
MLAYAKTIVPTTSNDTATTANIARLFLMFSIHLKRQGVKVSLKYLPKLNPICIRNRINLFGSIEMFLSFYMGLKNYGAIGTIYQIRKGNKPM